MLLLTIELLYQYYQDKIILNSSYSYARYLSILKGICPM
jgi:hypothetical protein